MGDRVKRHETNWWRVCRLLIECGRELLLHFFQDVVSPLSLRKFLIKEKCKIEQQKKKLRLSVKQLSLLYCEQKTTQQREDELELEFMKEKMDNWDITLISCLLNYFSENNTLTLTNEQCDSYNKIRELRNRLYAHRGKEGFTMTDSEFEQHWQHVVKVLQVLQESVPEVDIRNKIKSIQTETIVDDDQLKELYETFDNWMQSDREILDRLRQNEKKSDEQHASLTNTVKDGVTAVTEAVKESETTMTEAVKESETTVTKTVKESETTVTEVVKESETTVTKILKEHQQKLLQIQQQIQNKGAEATDRMPRKMHKGEERLSSQVSMDAEPDEDASGENVLADRFPKMTVNEPGDSRDESASSLHSNLTEQRRHNEMPPEIGYIDCLIMYAEADRDGAQKFKEHLINDIKIKEHGPVVALLYDDPKLRSLCECQVKYFEKVCELSTYKMLYMTEHFVNDKWEEFKRNACLVKSIEDETSSVVPVYPQKKKTIKVPIAINSLKGLKYYNNDEHYRQSLANLIEAQVEVRVKGNKNLVEKQKGRDRRDKEIDENHPQQDAFVQTCSQTPGASAEIQEAKTIPDLEEDTTDDVDLASSSHDDKMEQREENKRLEIDKQQQRTDKEIFDSHPQTPGASAEIPTATTIPDLEGDTLDDVDLPSSCHDDKMEQKEEAQIASLAEIKQKKKKKKKKKTRR